MNNQIKFNVIIPTRERADTLFHCLRTIVAQDYENLNIIVSDNFSQDNTKGVVHSFSDKRITYINPGKRISMSHNWEFALSHVDSGWVTFLGDDDGLLSGAIALLDDIISEFPCDAVNSLFCTYFWPNNGWSNGASLAIPTTKEGIKYLNSRAELASVMTGKSYKRLPWLYTGGFAAIEVINRARSTNGSFFMSSTPDVYSAIALSSVTEKFLRIGTPLAVAGASRHSTGLSATNSKNHGDSCNKWLSEENIPFHPSLIFGKTFRLLIYECYLQSHFLHHDFLDLNLKDQLELAIADNGMESREVIRDQCERIAELNGIKLSRTSLSSFTRLIKWNIIRQASRIANVPGRKLLLGEEVAGRNVFEASLRASEVISEANSRSNLTNSFQNIVTELKPRSVARRLKLIRYA